MVTIEYLVLSSLMIHFRVIDTTESQMSPEVLVCHDYKAGIKFSIAYESHEALPRQK